MSGVVKIEITESAETLKKLLINALTPKEKEKILTIYWLKTETVTIVQEIAKMLSRHRTTIQNWLRKYRSGGLNRLLKLNQQKLGRPSLFSNQALEKLKEKLNNPEGFQSYGEIQGWLNTNFKIEAAYKTVHKLVRYKLKAKLKVPRPLHIKQNKEAQKKFKQELSSQLEERINLINKYAEKPLPIRYWCQDETRIGLKTILGKIITACGVKPVGLYQWIFEYLWLYGVIEPKTGDSFFYEFSHLDTACFENFLELFSQKYPDEIHIIQLDNGRAHLGLDLSVPENIILLFQPPYSPELNPIERFWQEIKEPLKNKVFESLDFLRQKIDNILAEFSQKDIASITGYDFILEALSTAGI